MALKLPDQITQGDSLEWTATLSDFPSSAGWVVTYALRGNTSVDVTGTDAGGGAWSFALTTTASAGLLPGRYSYAVTASKTGARQTVYMASTTVTPDITSLSRYDGSSHAAKMVKAIEALMEGKAEDDVASMSHNGKSLARYPMEELIKLHNHYTRIHATEQARERVRLGLATGRQKITRFRG